MSQDWIEEIKEERDRGLNRPLTQAQHAAVNSRYPGLTVKQCPYCGAEMDDAQVWCHCRRDQAPWCQ